MSMNYERGLFTDQIGSALYTIAHGVVVAEVPDLASHMRKYGGAWSAGRKTADKLLASNDPIAAARRAGWQVRNQAEVDEAISKYAD